MNRKLFIGLLLAVIIMLPSLARATNLIDWTSTDGTLTFQQNVQVTFTPIVGSDATSYFFVNDPNTLFPIGAGLVANFSAGSSIGIESSGSLSLNFPNSGTFPIDFRGFTWANGPLVNIHGYTDPLNNLAANDPLTSVYWWFDWSQGTASETTGLISITSGVPEPSTSLLVVSGLLGLGIAGLKRRRKV